MELLTNKRCFTEIIIGSIFFTSIFNFQAFGLQPYCGPVAAYTVLKYFGIDITLDKVSQYCGYDNSPVEISMIINALEDIGQLDCSIKKINKKSIIRDLSKKGRAVLIMVDTNRGRYESEGIGHIVALLSTKNGVVYADYPAVVEEFDMSELRYSGDYYILVTDTKRNILRYVFFIPFAVLVIKYSRDRYRKRQYH